MRDSGVSSTKAAVWQHKWSPECLLTGVHEDSSHVKSPSVDSIAHKFTLRSAAHLFISPLEPRQGNLATPSIDASVCCASTGETKAYTDEYIIWAFISGFNPNISLKPLFCCCYDGAKKIDLIASSACTNFTRITPPPSMVARACCCENLYNIHIELSSTA